MTKTVLFDFIRQWEGGITDNPDDPGGATAYGITKRNYPRLYNLLVNSGNLEADIFTAYDAIYENSPAKSLESVSLDLACVFLIFISTPGLRRRGAYNRL
jgi:hypothetical protein